MIIDNKRNDEATSEASIISATLTMNSDKIKYPILITILPLLSVLAAILPRLMKSASGTDIAKLGIITLILSGAVTFYIRINHDSILNLRLAKAIITISYLGSIFLLLIIPNPETLCFWMIGGLLVAMLIDNKLGLLINFNMTFIMGIVMDVRPEIIIQILILCVLMSILSGALNNKSTVIYAAIIILSIHITLAFAMNNFIFEKVSNYNYVYSLISILAVLVTAFFLSIPYQSVRNIEVAQTASNVQDNIQAELTENSIKARLAENNIQTEQTENNIQVELTENNIQANQIENSIQAEQNENNIQAKQTDNDIQLENNLSTQLNNTKILMQTDNTNSDMHQDIPAVKEENPDSLQLSLQESSATVDADILANQLIVETRKSYEALCDLDSELMKRLNQFSESLYQHSLLIGNLSCRAAKEIGADEQLSMAGGLYHEIGKLNGKNYIEEGLKLAEEYSFPNELKAILKEHNIKYEKPNSVEAAIVMISDNVVSTLEYIEKTGDHKFTANKIIDNIFQMRLDKGNFDSTGLVLKDYKKLKEFYQTEFMQKE